MKPEEIVEGGIYQGSGACYQRQVDFIFPDTKTLHWFTPLTLPVRMANGKMFHTPNRCCSIAHFAKWAKEQIGEDDRS